ncbi:GNAT family N-acetyltransferase [Rhizobium sp. RU20A]|uniref:GNAT family N-acetyltransferase n=1 Tax=Rhizobium sp. RU20A TaxID=1907412 RepID=UPI00245306D9|nr:GNAT family N-acetyltransferase [Rhizobium sp. RU20A]
MAAFRTRNLLLRLCRPEDRADFMALERDAEVMHFLNGGPVDHATTDPDAVTFLMPRGTETDVWTARREDSGEFVGWFCLHAESESRAELGYRLARRHWGQGLASEGAAALVEWGFETAGYCEIVACTMAINHGSRRVMEMVGMRHTHSVVLEDGSIPGSEHGEVWYAVKRSDWRERKPTT